MEWVETTGKTVEEAQDAALDQLGIDHHDAEFEIVETPRAGLFGRMRGEARIRARVLPKAPRPKQERGGRRKPRTNRGEGGGRRNNPNQRSRPQQRNRAGSRNEEPTMSDDESPSPTDESPAVDAGSRRSSERRPDRGTPRPHDDRPILTVEEEGALVADFLEGLVDAFDLDADVRTAPIDEDTVQVDVDGDELGLLVGPRGNTLGAIHELSRTILQRNAGGGFQGRVRVDVAGYRARRREALTKFVQGLAAQVIETGRASALEPMNPSDRKVVHDTANEIDGVATRSQGEEPRRFVVIEPSNDA